MYPRAGRSGEGGGACGEILPAKGIRSAIDGRGYSTGASGASVSGFISGDVSSVELSYDSEGGNEVLDAATGQIPAKVLHQAGGRTPLGVFIAYLPEGIQPRDVTATAYDEDGKELGTTSWPDFSAPEAADAE
jgi:hypothetical protein